MGNTGVRCFIGCIFSYQETIRDPAVPQWSIGRCPGRTCASSSQDQRDIRMKGHQRIGLLFFILGVGTLVIVSLTQILGKPPQIPEWVVIVMILSGVAAFLIE